MHKRPKRAFPTLCLSLYSRRPYSVNLWECLFYELRIVTLMLYSLYFMDLLLKMQRHSNEGRFCSLCKFSQGHLYFSS